LIISVLRVQLRRVLMIVGNRLLNNVVSKEFHGYLYESLLRHAGQG
jgi:hypothetical protein